MSFAIPFKIQAIIQQPTRELRTIAKRSPNKREFFAASNGSVVIQMQLDTHSSAQLAPDAWFRSGKGFRPTEPQGSLSLRYVYPEFLEHDWLVGNELAYQLEASEASFVNASCRIVADSQGGSLEPIRRMSRTAIESQVLHATDSVFMGTELGLVQWQSRACEGGRHGRFSVCRARIVSHGLPLAVDYEVLHRSRFTSGSFEKLAATLPPDMAAWNASLNAVPERLGCTRWNCQGHYHRAAP